MSQAEVANVCQQNILRQNRTLSSSEGEVTRGICALSSALLVMLVLRILLPDANDNEEGNDCALFLLSEDPYLGLALFPRSSTSSTPASQPLLEYSASSSLSSSTSESSSKIGK